MQEVLKIREHIKYAYITTFFEVDSNSLKGNQNLTVIDINPYNTNERKSYEDVKDSGFKISEQRMIFLGGGFEN